SNSQEPANLTIESALKQVTKPKRATASDAGALLQGLAGSTAAAIEPARIDHARDRLRHTQPQDAWTDQERRKAQRAAGILADAQAKLDDVQAASLSRFSISETL